MTKQTIRAGGIGQESKPPESPGEIWSAFNSDRPITTRTIGTQPQTPYFDVSIVPSIPPEHYNGMTAFREGLTFALMGGVWRVVTAESAFTHTTAKDDTDPILHGELSRMVPGVPLSLGSRTIELTGGPMRRHVELWFRWTLSGSLDASTQLQFNVEVSGDWHADQFDNALSLTTPTGSGQAGKLDRFTVPFNLLSDVPIELMPRQTKIMSIELTAQLTKPYIPHRLARIEGATLALYSRSWNRTETL